MNRTIFTTISNPQYLRLLEKCLTMDQFKQIHAQTITIGLARFTYITSKLIAFSVSDIDYAHRILNQIRMPTIFDYNSMILGYSKTSKQEMGIFLYTQMRKSGINPNGHTFPILIKTCDCLPSLLHLHGQIMKLGNVFDAYLTSSLICMYSYYEAIDLAKQVFEESSYKNVVCSTSLITGCFNNGLVEDACKVFDEMPERNDVSYSAMISGFVKNELFNEAIELFHHMKNCGLVKPNRPLLLSILNACGAVGALHIGKSIHHQLVQDSFSIDLEFGTALIDFYAKCGDIEKAEDIFTNMPDRDVATWSSMVLGLATNGKNKMAIKLFDEMEKKGPVPNDITFIAVLVACNYKSLVSEAWRVLGKMCKVYSVRPAIEHYGCMVDLLARSGQSKEADILIKLMPMAPDGAIWASFLHGCLTNSGSETNLAERAGERLLELEPQHSGRYVLLANMYANMGFWEGVIRLRKMMLERNVSTAPGWSFVEVDGVFHKFFVGDRCHPRATDLHEILKLLNKEAKEMSAATFTASVTGSIYTGLNPNGSRFFQTTDSLAWNRKTVSNGSKVQCMKVWNPINNKKFETLSYLPPLTDDSIAKEIDYMIKKGWIPCLEFDSVGYVYRENSRIPNYYDGRYWTLWKLPMFGCNDASQVLKEIQECKTAYPNAYIRCLAFDNVRQAQCMSFVIQQPSDP